MSKSMNWSQWALHALMLLAAFLFAAPLLWMLATAFKLPEDIVNGLGTARWWPHPATTANFASVLSKTQEFPIWRWTANSLLISLAVTLLIPMYLLIRGLGWFDTYWALIVPAGASAFGVFLLRQFFQTIPAELEEAAVLDGCGPLGIFWHVILPLSKSALATLGIFTFMATWNAFEEPLIFTDSLDMRTLPIGITIFQGRYNMEYGPMMVAAALAAIPVTLAFLVLQKQIIKGISLTGLAGR